MKKGFVIVLKETLIQMIISVILVAVAAFVVLKLMPSEMIVKIMVLVIYGVASFVGGFMLGRIMGSRKFLWGMLAGGIYMGILIAASVIVNGGLDNITIMAQGIATSLLCGMLGGMVS